MNNLEKYVGLLNDIAPKGEFLAYINEEEAEILKDNGALGLLTPQGIPSYIGGTYGAGGGGAYQGGSGAPGSAESSDRGNNRGDNSNNNNKNSGVDPGFQEALRKQQAAQQQAAQQKAIRDKEIRQAQIRQQEIQKQKIAEQKRIEEAKRQDDARLDYITGKYLNVELNPEQKKEFEQYRTGVRESISPSTKTSNKIIGGLLSSILPGAGSLYNFYLDSTAMGYKMPNPFENLFGGGGEISVEDVNNFIDNAGSDSNVRSQLVQSISNAISADPYGGLMANNLTTNPYNIDYLRRLGLI
jgi:hypothetical protein